MLFSFVFFSFDLLLFSPFQFAAYDDVAEYVEEDAKATVLKCFFRMCTDRCVKKLRIEPNEEDGSADDQGPSRVHVVPQP